MPDTQYFTNIDGKYVKDAEARQQLNDLEDYVESLDQPWQPLEDGYSNFWFELTDDTLSPWLNFSAKTNNAVIDWGDGSGEVALDTLTPTHTYSKAGRYVVKVKGVTGIANQIPAGSTVKYRNIYKEIELNNEVTSLSDNAFVNLVNLENVTVSSITVIPQYVFRYCSALKTFNIHSGITTIGQGAFYCCFSLGEITIPATVTTINANAFYLCCGVNVMHCQSTTPPTLNGSNHFYNLPLNWICYVPVGYGETYKSAEGWSAYADHILEEGETPTRAMLAKFNSTKTDEPQDDMR